MMVPGLFWLFRFPLRLSIAWFQPQRPFDAPKNVLLVPLIFPHVFAVSERGVEDFSFAIFLYPGHREMAELLFMIRMLVEHKQLMHFARVVVFDDVNFFLLDTVRFTQMFGSGGIGILHQALNSGLGAMRLELAAEHLNIRRKTV